jgi:hypothetical protein
LQDASKSRKLYRKFPDIVSVVKPLPGLIENLERNFPTGKNTYDKFPELFSITCQKDLILIKESEVYVRFIDETATYMNTLCWYQYNKFAPPANSNDIVIQVVFPNISEIGEGGQLEPGYTVHLGNGKFPAGTVIGFCLIQKGWKDGIIDYDKRKLYTNQQFNTDNNPQHVLFKNTYFKHLLIGFEDIEFENPVCDKDYNDIFFEVTDNKDGYEATSFDLVKVVTFTDF